MSEQVWQATGLTCDHCAKSITKSLLEVAGMQNVNIDLKANQTSSITTVGTRDFLASEIAEAMLQAGKYILVS